jgi:L-glutamine-phosphate cytidylyltransferase
MPDRLHAVILAAGTGSRLMPLTRNTPKSLLDLGNGYTLLERQLQALAANDVHDVTIVTGYKGEQIEAKIRDYAEFNFRVTFNPVYRLTNQLVSAWMGLKDLTGPVVLINGDDLFRPEVLGRLLSHGGDISLTICRKGAYADEDMKVITDGEGVIDIGKDIDVQRANGESIGVIHFSKRGVTEINRQLLAMLRREENLHMFFPASLRELIRAGHFVGYVECSEDEWSEVDFHPDLQVMRNRLELSLPHWD